MPKQFAGWEVESVGSKASAFTMRERAIIAAWSEAMKTYGVHVEMFTALYGCFDDVMLVSPSGMSDPSWFIHKTTRGVLIRRWRHQQELVPTLAEALALIGTTATGAVRQDAAIASERH